MRLAYQIQKGKPYPLGVSLTGDGIHVAIPMECKHSCGIVLYIKKKEYRILFPKEYAVGNLYTVEITGLCVREARYRLFCDERTFADPYLNILDGRSKWGVYRKDDMALMGRLTDVSYDWGKDKPLEIPFHESIFYHAHVRGFTKHPSAKIKERGTFLGAIHKIPYLKELGITGVCFMPFYDFDELIRNPAYYEMDETINSFMEEDKQNWQYKVNYWGFSKEAFYFAPKSSYAYTSDPHIECKEMIRQFHEAGIEVLMQMYFPAGTAESFIYHVVRFWVEEYHIDGFLLQGVRIPQRLLREDPMLSKTKLIFENYEQRDDIQYCEEWPFKNSGFLNYDFMYDARKFLKGDGDMLQKMASHFRNNPPDSACINQITAYTGFTLMDLVSYNRKHNEANGEENHDGNDYNYSWNCGHEGETRRKTVVELRNRQYKNAVCLMMFAQGTPMIVSGDEFGNSHYGNNNPYCQDNATNWLNWGELTKRQDLFLFMKAMIAIRKEHPILHQERTLRIMDYIGCGYPDLSYHGEVAWYANFANYNRHIGLLYCGKYARRKRNREDDFIYIIYNMYWEPHEFALPKLPNGLRWYVVTDTSHGSAASEKGAFLKRRPDKDMKVTLPPRCIWILISDRIAEAGKIKRGDYDVEGNTTFNDDHVS